MTDDQRWSGRLRADEWAVRVIPLAICQDMVEREHYSAGGSNTATYRHGLFELAKPSVIRGIAWWIPPTKSAALSIYPEDWQGVLALSRLAIEPDVPKNAATFLLSRSRKMIDRRRWPCLVTYADTWQGHDGLIYKLDGWDFDGETAAEATWVIDGKMVSRKAGPTTRTVAQMQEMGAEMVGRHKRLRFTRTLAKRPVRQIAQGSLFGA